jgi:hypothetical protein
MLSKEYKFMVLLMMVVFFLVGCSSQQGNLDQAEQNLGLKVDISSNNDQNQNLQANDKTSFAVKVLEESSQKLILEKSDLELDQSGTASIAVAEEKIEAGEKYKVVVVDNNNSDNKFSKTTSEIIEGITTVEINLASDNFKTQSVPGALTPKGVSLANQDGDDKGKIALSWERRDSVGPYPFKQNYVIYRSETEQKPDEPLVSSLDAGSYVDSTVEAGQTYYYWIAGQDTTNESYESRVNGPIKITAKEDTPYFEKLSDGEFRFTFYPSKYDIYKDNLPAKTEVYLAGEMNDWGQTENMDQLEEVGNVWTVTVDLTVEVEAGNDYLRYKWYIDYGDNVVWYGFDGDSVEQSDVPLGDGDPDTYEHNLYVKLVEGAQHPVFWWQDW